MMTYDPMNASLLIDITVDLMQRSSTIPSDQQLQQWATCVLLDHRKSASLAIHLVEEEKMIALNQQYRQKTGVTNILSFEFDPPPGVTYNLLGDIVLCPSQISREIEIQPPPLFLLESRWAHLVIHGCLHLLGHHHTDDHNAQHMESLEIQYLKALGYPNPYEENN